MGKSAVLNSSTAERSEIIEEKIRKTILNCSCLLSRLPTYFREFQTKWGVEATKEAWEAIEDRKQIIEEIDRAIDQLIILKRTINFSTHKFGKDF